MTQFCANCGKPNTDTATACVACAHELRGKRPNAPAPPAPQKPDTRIFADDEEERAWVSFVAALGVRAHTAGWNAEYWAEKADELLVQLRARRRRLPQDGAYR